MPAQTEAASKPARRAVHSGVLVVFVFVAVFAFSADQLAKYFVVANLPVGTPVSVIGELLQFTFVRNPGAAFSMFSGTTWIFAIIASAVAAFIIFFAHRIKSFSWGILFGLLLGGNVGNLVDRLFREPGFGVGHVVDFIHVYGFPAIFNVADICIVSSMGLFIILTVRGIGLDGKKLQKGPKSTPAESTPAERTSAGSTPAESTMRTSGTIPATDKGA